MSSKYTLGLLIALFCCTFLNAQEIKSIDADPRQRDDDGILVIESPDDRTQPPVTDDNMIYNAVEVQPEFPGGLKNLLTYITKNLKYPESDEIKGNVYVIFIVEKDGSLSDIKVVRDLGYGTGAEVKRVLSLSPKWKPGIQNGRTVRCRYALPIKLDNTVRKP